MIMKNLLFLTLFVVCITSYNETEGILQAKLSVISHCSTAQIEAWNCALCKTYPNLKHTSVI